MLHLKLLKRVEEDRELPSVKGGFFFVKRFICLKYNVLKERKRRYYGLYYKYK